MTNNKHQLNTRDADTAITLGVARLSGIKFSKDTPQAQRQHILNELKDLKNKIPAIKLLQVGETIPNPPLDKGLTHGIVIGFSGLDGLRAYTEHQAFKDFVKLFAGSVLEPGSSWETDVPVAPDTQISADAFPNVLHIVGLKIKRPAPQGQEDREEQILNKLKSLPGETNGKVKLFLGGTPVEKNQLDQDFTQGFLVGFNTEADLLAYKANSHYKSFVDFLLAVPMLDDELVFDIRLGS